MSPQEKLKFSSPHTFTREVIQGVHQKIRGAVVQQVHDALSQNPTERAKTNGIHVNVPSYVVAALRFRPYIRSQEYADKKQQPVKVFFVETPPDRNKRNEKRNLGKINLLVSMWHNDNPHASFKRNKHGIEFPNQETFNSFLSFVVEKRQTTLAQAV